MMLNNNKMTGQKGNIIYAIKYFIFVNDYLSMSFYYLLLQVLLNCLVRNDL